MSARAKRGGGGRRSGEGERPLHPIQEGIEKLHAAGKTPRIRIDARRNDVVVPAHVRAKWQESLVIDLDPSYPLNLVYAPEGIDVDLAFAGLVSRCTFPWPSIYGLFDRASGQGVQIVSHVPPTELPEALRVAPASPKLRAISPPSEPAASHEKTSPADEAAKARRAKFRVIPGG